MAWDCIPKLLPAFTKCPGALRIVTNFSGGKATAESWVTLLQRDPGLWGRYKQCVLGIDDLVSEDYWVIIRTPVHTEWGEYSL